MIALVRLMITARRAQAALVVLLSALATAAAVAGPVYTASVDRAAVVAEVANTPPEERTVAIQAGIDSSQQERFDSLADDLAELPRFNTVLTAILPVLGLEGESNDVSWLTFRDGLCEHVRIVTGRCLMAAGEVVVGESTARRLKVTPGGSTMLSWARYDDITGKWFIAGRPEPITVVGVYRPLDRDEPYWGRSGYFAPTAPDTAAEPLFAGRPTVDGIEHDFDNRTVEAIPGPGALDADHLPELSAALDKLSDDLGSDDETSRFASFTNELPGFFERVHRSDALTRELVPLAGLPLIGLCWLVIFVAVAGSTAARRHEQALIALRGAPRIGRFWLAAGESVIAIAVGAPLGYLAGTLATRAVADARFGPIPVFDLTPAPGAVSAALIAVAGAVLVGLLALRRDLASPVVDLLRRVPARGSNWQTIAIDAGAVVLAVLATVQLRAFDGQLLGLGLLVPGLIGLALAVLVGRLLMPLAAWLGRRAVERGRLGLALGALQVARRPGSQRLFVLLAVAVAVFGFATTTVDVADRARADRAAVQTGAIRTVEVAPTDSGTLRAAVRAVDPDGRFAMAVGTRRVLDGPQVLFADTAALPAVANWRPEYGGRSPAEVAAALRPPDDEPVIVKGVELALAVDYGTPTRPGTELHLTALLRPLAGGAPVRAGSAKIEPGRHSWPLFSPACADGCRLAGIEAVYSAAGGEAAEVSVVSLAVRADWGQPLTDVVPAFTTDKWRANDDAKATAADGGVHVVVPGAVIQPKPTVLVPTGTPVDVPVLSGGPPPRSGDAEGVDGNAVAIRPVGQARALPRIGTGLLMDLGYAEWLATGSTDLDLPEVWLGPAAPPDIEQRLAAKGLVVTGRDSMAAAADRLDGRGPALAVWFHPLAGGVAVLLAACGMWLMAAVDRRRVLDDMVALRRQGLAARTGGSWVLWAYLPVAIAAVVTGLVAAVIAWAVVGRYVPYFVDDDFALAAPTWPRLIAIALPAVVAALLFTTVAVGLRRALRVRD
ncbi:FtsX-like permease family protein [Asanoa sp. NPDC049518]|uniref:FtsX-like permease family protein n=1 Tax=unclassified Asanoa TaxID=2685164 RepID=UPI00342BEA03